MARSPTVEACSDSAGLESRIEELEQLLRQSAYWGQHLVQRIEELESESKTKPQRKTSDASRDADSGLREYQSAEVIELQKRLQDAELRVEAMEDEAYELQQQVKALSSANRQKETMLQHAQFSLESERREALALRTETSRLRQELQEKWEDEAFRASTRMLRAAPGEEIDCDEDPCSLATELGNEFGATGRDALENLAEAGVFDEADLALLEQQTGDGSPSAGLRPGASQLEYGHERDHSLLREECEQLRARILQALGPKFDESLADIELTHAKGEDDESCQAAHRLRAHVEALLLKFGNVREDARNRVKAALEAQQTSEKECIMLRTKLESQAASLDFDPPRRHSANSFFGEEEDREADGCGSMDALRENRELRREMRQVRKEVEGACEWERSARKTTEAKQHMLRLHEALLRDSKSQDSADAISSEEVQRLRQAVVRAADQEEEARELLAAKQELLAEVEQRLRESDRRRLEEVVNSVETAPSRHGFTPSKESGAIFHAMDDD